MTAHEWLTPTHREPLEGGELFTGDIPGLDLTVREFWGYAMSDLRMNNVRGYLAEFLVARATGAEHTRIEWDAADVLTPDGIRVEVKTSGYLQAWRQQRHSRIVFTGLRGRAWVEDGGRSPHPTYNADVYVFAVQTATSHDNYDPLDVDQWAFWVLPRATLAELDVDRMTLTGLQPLAMRVTFTGLDSAIRSAHAR